MNRGGERLSREPEPRLSVERLEEMSPAEFRTASFGLFEARTRLDRTDRRLEQALHEERATEFRSLHRRAPDRVTGFDYEEATREYLGTLGSIPYLVPAPASTDHFDKIDAIALLPKEKVMFGLQITMNPLKVKAKQTEAEAAGLRAPSTLIQVGLDRRAPFARFVIAPPEGDRGRGWYGRYEALVADLSLERAPTLTALGKLSAEDRKLADAWILGGIKPVAEAELRERMKMTGFRSRSHADQVGREIKYLKGLIRGLETKP